MEFGRYLAQRRRWKARVEIDNPAADQMLELLQKHLKTVARWLNGQMDYSAMLEAMKFFARSFPGQYRATPGRLIYRGQTHEFFDGKPASYSYDASVAAGFACNQDSTVVIKRRVCSECADKPAFRLSLDMAKLLAKYGDHEYAQEKEVVILNTPPKGKTAELMEAVCT